MVYAIFGWDGIEAYCMGYITNREEAEKYCIKYKEDHNGDKCWIEEIKDLSNKYDLSNINIVYKHTIVFDFYNKDKKWVMRNEPNRYQYYSGTTLRGNNVEYFINHKSMYSWIKFDIILLENNRQKAEKIAKDFLDELIYESHSSDNSILPKVIDNFIAEEKDDKNG